MKIINKNFFIAVAISAIAIALGIIWHINKPINHPETGSIKTSPSGQFKMVHVLIDSYFSNNTMAYLRITDNNRPDTPYRPPLYDTLGAEFRIFENDKRVGISWLTFDKKSKIFTV